MPAPVRIKPDMSKEERHRESILLKERWSLIESGVPRESIKIRNNLCIYVNNKIHVKWDSNISSLKRFTIPSPPMTNSCNANVQDSSNETSSPRDATHDELNSTIPSTSTSKNKSPE